MTSSSPATPKSDALTYFTIFGSITFSAFLYTALAFFMETTRSRTRLTATPAPMPGINLGIGAVALLSLLAASAFMVLQTRGRIDGAAMPDTNPSRLSHSDFQTVSIIALALAEVCAIAGLVLFFLGGPAIGILPYVGGTLAVNFLVILPIALRYWKGELGDEASGPYTTIK